MLSRFVSTAARRVRFFAVILLVLAGTAHAAPFAYITNNSQSSNSVSVIDTATNTVVATVAVGLEPFGVAVNLAGTRVYVTNSGSVSSARFTPLGVPVGGTVSVIDTATNTVIATVAVGNNPQGVAVNPAGTRVYVANDNDNNVSVIDTATNTVVAFVAVGASPVGVAVNPAGTRVYVVNRNGRTVSVINTATNAVVATVPVGFDPIGVAVNPAGTRAYVANSGDGDDDVSVIDTATNTVLTRVGVGNVPKGVAVNPAGTRVYVTNSGNGTVSVIDTATNNVVDTVTVGGDPFGVDVNPTGTRAYVASREDNNVSVIDTATNTVVATVVVGNDAVAFGRFIGGGASLPPAPPTITNGPPPNGTVGVAYNFAFTSTGNPTFNVVAEVFPPGLSISSTGVISGIPTAPGTFSGFVTASNGTPPNATQNFTITISAPAIGDSIPTLSEWGAIFLVMSLLAVGLWKLR